MIITCGSKMIYTHYVCRQASFSAGVREGGAGGISSSEHPRSASISASIPHSSAAPGVSGRAVPSSAASQRKLTVLVAKHVRMDEIANKMRGYRFRMPRKPLIAVFPNLADMKYVASLSVIFLIAVNI